MSNEIKIDVTNTVQLQGQGGEALSTPAQEGRLGDFANILNARFLVQGGVKLANSLGSPQLSKALAQASKFGFLGARVISGDPMAMAAMALDLGAEAIKVIMQDKKDRAKMMNEIDNARMRAGLLSIGNASVSENMFTGRYKYGRGG